MYGEIMENYFNILIKTVILYFFMIIVLRIMGKREIGELSLFDVVVIFLISEILSISITNTNSSILMSIIPIIVIVILEKIIAKICFNNIKFRNLIYGKSEIIIIDGKFDLELMKKEKYNLNDVINQLHDQNIATPDEVKFAVLESNGKIRAFKYDTDILWPEPIIYDGKLNDKVISKLNINILKLKNELSKRGYNKIEDVLICYLLKDDLYVHKKIMSNKK